MKKLTLVTYLLCIALLSTSCITITNSINDKTEDEKGNFSTLAFDSNNGVIAPLLPESDSAKIARRTLTIEDGEENYDMLIDTFEIETGGTFYYPFIPHDLSEKNLPISNGIPFEIMVGTPTDNDIALIKSSIANYDFKPLAIDADKKVTCFEFINKVGAEELEGAAPSMSVTLDKQYRNQLFTYEFEGATFNDEQIIFSSFIENYNLEASKHAMLVFEDKYPDDFHIKGFTNGALDNPIEGIDVEVQNSQESVYELLVKLYDSAKPYEKTFLDDADDYKKLRLLRTALAAFHEEREANRWNNRLDDLLANDIVASRIFYLKFELTDHAKLTLKRPLLPSSNHYRHGSENNNLNEYYLLSSDYPTDFKIDRDIQIAAAFSPETAFKDTANEAKTAFEIPANKDFRLIFKVR